MSTYLKPQSPLYHKEKDAYFYPLTTVDQVIMENGNRLNTVFKSTVRKTVTLLADNWSVDAPYTQTITVTDVNFDDLKVDAHVAYTGNKESDLELSKGYSCVSYVKKDGNSITFSCLKDKPTINMPVEIVGTSCDSIATVEEGTKLNFDIVAYATEEELLADTPMENTIGVVTTTPISKWVFDSEEPENPIDDMLWIRVGTESQVEFSVIEDTDIPIYPMFAKQYVSGAWVNVTAMSYQNGTWVDWIPYIILNGVLQGTFDLSGKIRSDNVHTITQESGYLRYCDPEGQTSGLAISTGIDVTNISKLVLVCNIINPGSVSDGGCGIGLAKALNATSLSAVKSNIVASEMRTAAGDYTLELNVEDYSDLYYPCIWANSVASNKVDMYIYDFYYIVG